MAGIDIDVTEVLAAADDLRSAADKLVSEARSAVADGAGRMRDVMRADMSGSGHFGAAARSISYELAGNASIAEAKIGPTKGGAGSIANIAYFGGAHGGGGTVRDPLDAAAEEQAAVEKALGDLAGGLL